MMMTVAVSLSAPIAVPAWSAGIGSGADVGRVIPVLAERESLLMGVEHFLCVT